jgi:heavy metal translocating P-type ATPase
MIETRAAAAVCLHCGKELPHGGSFCCSGCESVHSLLVRRGLGHFYDLRAIAPIAPVRAVTADCVPDAARLLAGDALTARFYIEGIHCLGCLWLLEKLPEIDSRVKSSSLDLNHAILTVSRSAEVSWTEISALVRELGYTPRPLENETGEAARKRELSRQATRLGVAAFCSGNIMLLAVALYAGASGILARNFQLLACFLSLPALTYSAFPIYRAAWVPLRHGRASVDLSIALALLAGFGLSVANLLLGRVNETYFDSLTMLVFLLLSSRYLLSRFRESMAKDTSSLSFLSEQRLRRVKPAAGEIPSGELRAGDEFELADGQTLPVDATLLQPEAHFDFSLLTGESAPLKLRRGDTVEAGTRLLEARASLRVLRPVTESRLAKILEQIRAFQVSRSPSLDYADRIGRRFVLVVLLFAAAVALLLPYPEGVHRALVLVIVTCPCVLAFAVPLAFTRALQVAAKDGILFRGNDKLEELARAETAFLDKTGTLTNGDFEVLRWIQIAGDERETKRIALAVESPSGHPVAKALVRYLDEPSLRGLNAELVREIPGEGIYAEICGASWEILRLPNESETENFVGVFRNGALKAKIALGDRLRSEAVSFVKELRELGLRPVILSGDGENRVAHVAKVTGITEWRSHLSPEEKARIVRATPHALMLGDGANDSVAFQAASVSIAVRGAVDLSLRNADVALATSGLTGALRAIRTANRAMRVVRTNFRISLAYNVLAGTLALAGGMSPLLAAVLMPLSALSVFTFTQWSTRRNQP